MKAALVPSSILSPNCAATESSQLRGNPGSAPGGRLVLGSPEASGVQRQHGTASGSPFTGYRRWGESCAVLLCLVTWVRGLKWFLALVEAVQVRMVHWLVLRSCEMK